MATNRQIHTNRLNAGLSTGTRTERGNPLRHGPTANLVELAGRAGWSSWPGRMRRPSKLGTAWRGIAHLACLIGILTDK